jgi:hypothetical protein
LLVFSTCHPQIDSQTEIVYKTLTILLGIIIQKNLKNYLPFIEFAYNRNVYSITNYSPFEIIYGFNHLTYLDSFPLPIDEMVSLDGNREAEVVKAFHENVRRQI